MADVPATADGEGLPSSVVEQVLGSFLTTLEADPGYEAIGARLRETLLDKGDHSEAALKRALFGEAAE